MHDSADQTERVSIGPYLKPLHHLVRISSHADFEAVPCTEGCLQQVCAHILIPKLLFLLSTLSETCRHLEKQRGKIKVKVNYRDEPKVKKRS